MSDQTGEPSLEERLQRLEDIEAIKQLKFQYAVACDEGYDPDRLVAMFTEDAVWTGELFGTHRGTAELHRYYKGVSDLITWAQHNMLDPIITIDPSGISATGIWNLLQICTMKRSDGNGSDAVLIAGQYSDTYVKRDGRWLNQEVKVHFHCITNFDQGWVKQPFRD